MRFKLFLILFLFPILSSCSIKYGFDTYKKFYSEIEIFPPDGNVMVRLVDTLDVEMSLARYKGKGYTVIGVSEFVSRYKHPAYFGELYALARLKGADVVIIGKKYLGSEKRNETYSVPHTSPVFTQGQIRSAVPYGKYNAPQNYNQVSYVTTYSAETREVTVDKYEHCAYFLRKTDKK